MPSQFEGVILRNERIQSSYFLLEIHCPPIAQTIRPGQFVMLKVSPTMDPLLRRPFSLFRTNPLPARRQRKKEAFSILYKVVGKGTRKLTEMRKGEKADLIGPLGNGFALPSPPPKRAILVGGGVGVVALYPLAEALEVQGDLMVFIGARTKGDVLCSQEFKRFGSRIYVATEDGSLGYRGTVVDLLLSKWDRVWKEGPYPIYSSGPTGMLKELTEALGRNRNFCEASFEARMACGFGACWGCVIRTKDPVNPYQRVCKEGPVFNLGNILWEEQ